MIGDRIDIAAAYLRAGNVVGIPTETVYGLACNALDVNAVAKVFEIKNRPHFDPLIIHVDSLHSIVKYASFDHEILVKIAKDQMPGPLTILLNKKYIISDIVTAGSEQVAIRIPAHPIVRKLLKSLDFPLAAPSANPFGYISPTTAQHVDDQLGNKIPYILDGGKSGVGIESTIVGMAGDRLKVYRKGGLSLDLLRRYDKNMIVNETSSSNPKAPGMLKSHYAPKTLFKIVSSIKDELKKYDNQKIGVLSYLPFESKVTNHLVLSLNGDHREAASNLFSHMRMLDECGLNIILTELVPEEGLGTAINDRLRRAAADTEE